VILIAERIAFKELHYLCDFDWLNELHYVCDFDLLKELH
jgi:hypothetical protein